MPRTSNPGGTCWSRHPEHRAANEPVMPGLVPGIHVGGADQPAPQAAQAHTPHQQSPRHDVDGRDTPGHDDGAGRAAPTGHAANQPVLRGPLPGAHADASGDDDLGPVP